VDPQELMAIYSPIRASIVSTTLQHQGVLPVQRLASGVKVARIIERRHVDTFGKPDKSKVTVFDNSLKPYRYNGNSPNSFPPIQQLLTDSKISLPNPQPGTYVATKGNNNLFASLAAERAYYRDNETYKALLSGDKRKLREYFDMENLMEDRYILEQEVTRPINYINTADPSTRRAMQEIYKEHMKELLYLYKDFNIPNLPDANEPNELLDFFLSGPTYDLSQPIGNTLLSNSLAIKFPSARTNAAPTPLYFEGSSNFVIPNNLFGSLEYNNTYYALNNKTLIKSSNGEESAIAKIKDNTKQGEP
jgi:hypothetical protein